MTANQSCAFTGISPEGFLIKKKDGQKRNMWNNYMLQYLKTAFCPHSAHVKAFLPSSFPMCCWQMWRTSHFACPYDLSQRRHWIIAGGCVISTCRLRVILVGKVLGQDWQRKVFSLPGSRCLTATCSSSLFWVLKTAAQVVHMNDGRSFLWLWLCRTGLITNTASTSATISSAFQFRKQRRRQYIFPLRQPKQVKLRLQRPAAR